MTRSKKLILSASRDIPLNKLVLSQSNVRHIKAGVSIEELAEDIARRTLLQSITVRPLLDADGADTGLFEIPAGGRRFRALELLVKQKRLAKNAPVPCVVRQEGIAEEDSLAENIQRAPLHPLDQFRAFQALREKGQSEEEIAAAFFVSVAVVRQRLRLAAVSPRLLDIYAEDGLTLDQLMAFAVAADHERQEQVFEQLQGSYCDEPYVIRRMLTEGAVGASDKRAQFVGLDVYLQAGGLVLRDLFQGDDGGWLQDAALLDRLAGERLQREAELVRAEGWKWVEIAPAFPYGHTYGLRQLRGKTVALTEQEQSARDVLQAEYDELESTYAEAEELPEDVDRRLAEIEAALAILDERPVTFDGDKIGRAGAFVSIDGAGNLRVERGYVRPEDELSVATDADTSTESEGREDEALAQESEDETVGTRETDERDDEDGLKPLPDRLMTELTAHRTLALRRALGDNPDLAFLAALHALCLQTFYHYAIDSCLELSLKSTGFGAQAGLNDSVSAQALDTRHQAWVVTLPDRREALWDALTAFDHDSRQALFAHCVASSVNAVFQPYDRRPHALAHAGRLAQILELDMSAAGWAPTVETYFGRVTKARILAAMREAKGERAVRMIEHLKKVEMAETAEQALAGTGWLPEPLRTAGLGVPAAVAADADTADTDAEQDQAPEDGPADRAPFLQAAE